jgi:hypothetical protein
MKSSITSQKEAIIEDLVKALADVLLGERVPLDIYDVKTGVIIIPAGRKILKSQLRKMAVHYDTFELDPSPIRGKIRQIVQPFAEKLDNLKRLPYKVEFAENQFLADIVSSIPQYDLREILKRVFTCHSDFRDVRYEKWAFTWLDKEGCKWSTGYPNPYLEEDSFLTQEIFRWYYGKTQDTLARVRRSIDSEALTSLGKVLAVSEILELHS